MRKLRPSTCTQTSRCTDTGKLDYPNSNGNFDSNRLLSIDASKRLVHIKSKNFTLLFSNFCQFSTIKKIMGGTLFIFVFKFSVLKFRLIIALSRISIAFYSSGTNLLSQVAYFL